MLHYTILCHRLGLLQPPRHALCFVFAWALKVLASLDQAGEQVEPHHRLQLSVYLLELLRRPNAVGRLAEVLLIRLRLSLGASATPCAV